MSKFIIRDGVFLMESVELFTPRAPMDMKFHT